MNTGRFFPAFSTQSKQLKVRLLLPTMYFRYQVKILIFTQGNIRKGYMELYNKVQSHDISEGECVGT